MAGKNLVDMDMDVGVLVGMLLIIKMHAALEDRSFFVFLI